jgi:hypothetical protein
MTLIVSWIGVDSRKISSLYMASDSRISWGNRATFDSGRKVFGCKNHPVIIGYCGDVMFPSMVISQLVDLADNGLLFPDDSSNVEKFEIFFKKLQAQFASYPSEKSGVGVNSFEILFGSRDKETDFFCRKLKWTKLSNTWTVEDLPFSMYSEKLFIMGSGRTEFLSRYHEFQRSNESKTSRAVFQCLCETLENMKDNYCGGAPQLVGLYNRHNSKQFGIIHQNKRYLHGIELNNSDDYNRVEWRNKLFEICDGTTKEIKSDAQRQPRSWAR